jgi:adenine-specific DNA-methyltransferase
MQTNTKDSFIVSRNLFEREYINLEHPFFKEHLITYIGNKRSLLPFINESILDIKYKLAKKKLVMLDGFSGSGSVSRLFLIHGEKLISNDLEQYARIINKTYLTSEGIVDEKELWYWVNFVNSNKYNHIPTNSYFISKQYAPKDDTNIKEGERAFYTTTNAMILDNIRYLIHHSVPEPYRSFIMANLLIKASVHTNTSGVFKGFHKKEGIGHFGGKGENALSRIKQEISVDVPLLISHSCEVVVEQEDVNELVKKYSDSGTIFDVAYFDPPYNQHPYGSNYFMLNIISSKEDLDIQDGISGIVKNWNRSHYNKRKEAEKAMEDLVSSTSARFILISYNNEGTIPMNVFKSILGKYGTVTLKTQEYNTYRGSRNLKDRDNKVQELLWILEKDELCC